jgi:GNAT superfamily N-acetyltransferase
VQDNPHNDRSADCHVISHHAGLAETEDSDRTGRLRRSVQILQQDGFGCAAWRIGRKFVSPIMKAEAYFMFDTALGAPAPADPGETMQVQVCQGLESFESVEAHIASMGIKRNVAERLERGEAVAIVSCKAQAVGFTWVAFADVPVKEFDLTIVVPTGYIYHYDSFVLPEWRGRGVHAFMIKTARQFARDRGCERSVSWINVLNQPSLRLMQKWNRQHGMIILYLRLRIFARPLRAAFGQPLCSRFRKP